MRLRRLTLTSIERLQELADELREAGFVRRLFLLNEYMGLLVQGRWPILKLRHLQDILENHGMYNNRQGSTKSLTPIACFLGARLHKTPIEIKDQVAVDEVQSIYVELLRKDIEHKISLMLAYHNPKELQKAIKKEQTKLRHKPQKRRKKKNNVIKFPIENNKRLPVRLQNPNSACV